MKRIHPAFVPLLAVLGLMSLLAMGELVATGDPRCLFIHCVVVKK